MAEQSLPSIPGYRLTTQLYASSRISVYRANCKYTGKPVVIKVLQSPQPSLNQLARFRNQYIIATKLDMAGIVKPLDLVTWNHGYALVMDDVGGISLDNYIQTHGPLTVEQIISIGLKLTDSLHYLGQHRVLHKDINPANILIHPDTHQIWLTDFGLASLLPKENQELQSPNALEGTLAYIAPEQTGRMNRGIDYRADFYSLGVTLYELLTGQLPFPKDDPLELIHCHIAKSPPVPLSPCPPVPLSSIVLKLMAKNAEDRYQSALGLKHDLQQCLDQWNKTGSMVEFELGTEDRCDRFLIPEKLYGRETDVQTLLDAFERVAQGASELILVAGYSGVGKTAVVNEIHKPIVKKRGYFVKGKYDQFNRNIPFSAFVEAFRDLMGQLLAESDDQLQAWKAEILATVGDNGQILIDVIPELETIIGPQPPVPELSGSAAQNRFNLLFENFIAVFSTPDHPLVMFLDDLQWVDSASLNLLNVLMDNSQTGHLLLLGAYRDNEVFPTHPLMLALDELETQNTPLSTIKLAPLSASHINQLVAETLRCTVELATSLTDIVYQETSGNPFFTIQLLKGLYEDGVITFDRNVGYWECDLVRVRTAALTDDVVTFMVGRLHRLPATTQNILKLAACIGNQFDLETLATICDTSSTKVADELWSALQSGLVLPQSEAYKFFQGLEEYGQNQNIPVNYHFLHDRVQQAAYALIAEEHKQTTHLIIGRLLLQKLSPEEREKSLFKIVNQLNMGISLIGQPREIEDLTRLNLMAAQKAKSAAAYTASAGYLTVAIKLLHTETISADPWHSHYGLMLPLHNLLAEVSYLNGDYDISQQQAQTVIEHAQNLLDQVKAYEILISLSVAQGQCQKALDIGLEILGLLDVSLDETPLPNIDIERLYRLPTITHAKIIAALSILSKIWAPSHISGSELFVKVIVTMLNLSVTHGNSAIGAFAYSLYGMLLCAKMTDIELGYSFGQLALHTLERYQDAEFTCKVNQLFHAFIRNWKEPARDRVECLADNVHTGLERGDIEFACYASINYCDNLFLIGEPLNIIHKKQTYYIELAKSLQQPMQHATLCSWGQMVDNLMGMADEPTQLTGKKFDEAEQIPNLQESGVGSTLFFIYTAKTILNYLFNNYEQTLAHSQAAMTYEQTGEGMLPITQVFLYRSLGLLALYPTFEPERQAQSLDEVETYQQRLRVWANHAPMNHQHKVDLVAAEKCRVLGHKSEALDLYDQAIAGAQENEYLQEEALANELAAKFWLSWGCDSPQPNGKEEIAAIYLKKAYYCYDRWGATAKTEDLRTRYTNLLRPIFKQANAIDPLKTLHNSAPLHLSVQSSASNSLTPHWDFNSVLDLTAILKSARTLSESVDLNQLLNNLTPMMLQTSGAERLVLLLPDVDYTWHIKVIATPETTQLVSEPLRGNLHLPVQLIQYVQRTQEILVVDGIDLSLSIIDPYLQQHRHRSVLCLPLMHQSKLNGLLYLDHRSVAGVFSRDRITVLNFLCTQAAISLENALLNQALTQKLHIQTTQRQASEERLQQVATNVPGMIYQVEGNDDGSLTVLYASAHCKTLYGVSAEAMVSGQYNFRDFEYSDDKPVIDQMVAHCFQTLQTFDHQFRIITPAGTLKWVHVISHPTRQQETGPTIWDGVVMDISDRKATELALQETQTQLHQLIKNIPGMVFRYVLHPDNSHNFTYVSSYISELYGMTPEEVLSKEKSPWDIVHPEDVDYLASKIQESAQTLQPLNVEHRFILPQKGLRWGQNIGRPEQQANGDIVWHGMSFDITDRKAAEIALKDAQTQFRRMTENVPGMIYRYVLHPDGSDQLTYVSAQVQKLFEVDPETALQNTTQVWGRIHPDDVPRISHDIQVSAETLQPFTSAYRLLLPEKGLRWVQNMSQPERLDNGDVVWDGIAVDISDRKAIENSLNLTQAAVDKAALEIFYIRADGSFLQVNEAACAGLGYSHDELTRLRVWDINPDMTPHDWPYYWNLLQQNSVANHDVNHQRKDGSIYPVEIVSRYLEYDGEGISFAQVQDISDRRNAELALEKEVLRRNTIFNASGDGIHIIDRQGNLIEANATFFKNLGYTPEAGRHLNIIDWDAGFSREEIQAKLQTPPSEIVNQVVVHETLHQRKDGSIFPIEVYVSAMEWNGQLSFICNARDISERKQAEAQLQQTLAQLQASNNELESFAYSVSHDLRAPLRAINGFSQALFEDYGHLFDKTGQDYFGRIRSNTNRMGQLIDDLLQLSRLSRSELRYGTLDLSIMAQEVLHDLQSSDPDRHVEMIVQPGVVVVADAALMQVVLMNLLQNAWKFTRHHPTARIEFGTLPSQLSTSSGPIYFVKDDGAGFDMTYNHKLFGVFQRLHSTNDFPGTGIGLAAVRRAIHRHGGRVWAEAAIEQGATIFFTLPTQPEETLSAIAP